jgi:hypothetical protein
MHWPLVGIGVTVEQFMVAYREVFCRAEGFEHVSRYTAVCSDTEDSSMNPKFEALLANKSGQSGCPSCD